MAKAFGRAQRVADFLKRELSMLIQRQLRDPRLGMISITDVELSRDLTHAKVYFTVLGVDSAEQAKISLEILSRASGFLRTEVAKILTMRSVPNLHFIYDESVQRGLQMSALIDAALASDAKHDNEEDNGAS